MINRRHFNKILVGSVALSFAACSSITNVSLPKNRKRVVVVGGGFGGATTAKYLKKFNPETEVILIEQNKEYYTCPFGNTVIAGMNDIEYIRHDYKTLKNNRRVKRSEF